VRTLWDHSGDSFPGFLWSGQVYAASTSLLVSYALVKRPGHFGEDFAALLRLELLRLRVLEMATIRAGSSIDVADDVTFQALGDPFNIDRHFVLFPPLSRAPCFTAGRLGVHRPIIGVQLVRDRRSSMSD
jgi:hypothetical protein